MWIALQMLGMLEQTRKLEVIVVGSRSIEGGQYSYSIPFNSGIQKYRRFIEILQLIDGV